MARIKNRVEKILSDLSNGDQFLALAFGRMKDALPAIDAASDLRNALGLATLSRTLGPLRKAFRAHGWRAILCAPSRTNEGDVLFHAYAARFATVILQAATVALTQGDASELRNLADALEMRTKPADPLGMFLFSTKVEGNPKTASEIETHLGAAHELTSPRTIRRRAAELGVALKPDKRGAPQGKRKSVHRAGR